MCAKLWVLVSTPSVTLSGQRGNGLSLSHCQLNSFISAHRPGVSSIKHLSIPLLSLALNLAHIASDWEMTIQKTPHRQTRSRALVCAHVRVEALPEASCGPRAGQWVQLQLGGRPEEDCTLTLLLDEDETMAGSVIRGQSRQSEYFPLLRCSGHVDRSEIISLWVRQTDVFFMSCWNIKHPLRSSAHTHLTEHQTDEK